MNNTPNSTSSDVVPDLETIGVFLNKLDSIESKNGDSKEILHEFVLGLKEALSNGGVEDADSIQSNLAKKIQELTIEFTTKISDNKFKLLSRFLVSLFSITHKTRSFILQEILKTDINQAAALLTANRDNIKCV